MFRHLSCIYATAGALENNPSNKSSLDCGVLRSMCLKIKAFPDAILWSIVQNIFNDLEWISRAINRKTSRRISYQWTFDFFQCFQYFPNDIFNIKDIKRIMEWRGHKYVLDITSHKMKSMLSCVYGEKQLFTICVVKYQTMVNARNRKAW